MARKPRVEVPGGLYHVISRGNNRRKIFDHTTITQVHSPGTATERKNGPSGVRPEFVDF